MKWFLIQLFFLALACFGLGALFHRLLWRKGPSAGSSSTGSVNLVSALEEAQNRRINGDAAAARAAESAAVRAEHDKVLADRESRIKEFAALSFEHAAAKAALADRDESVTALRSQLDAAAPASSAASAENQGLLGQVESHRATIEELRSQLAAAGADKDAALAAMRADYHGRLAALSSKHDAALAELRVECDGRLATENAALAALRSEHDLAVQEARGDRDRILSRLRSDHERSLAELRRRAESAEHDLTRLTAVHEGCAGKLARLREKLDTTHGEVLGLMSEPEATKLRVVDDLEAIEGIGPAMAKALEGDGIFTFAALAGADEARLRSAIEQAGQRFAPSIPTWARQAAYLAVGDHDGFTTYTNELIAGVDPAGLTVEAGNDGRFDAGEVQAMESGAEDPGGAAAFEGVDVPADDLLRIEGIGPKISEILIAGGVRTFRRLAVMREERVRSIVNAGGVSFIPSVGSWAAQAALLRDGDEAGFQALVDRLVSGRDDGG